MRIVDCECIAAGFLLVAYLSVGSPARVSATQLHVPSQYPTIQAALAVAGYSDTIVLAAGNYSGPGFTDLSNMSRWYGVLIAPEGPEKTIVDLEGNRFFTGALAARGITLRNGSTAVTSNDPDLRECHFESSVVAIRQPPAYSNFMDVISSVFAGNDTAIITDGPWDAFMLDCVFLQNGIGVFLYAGPETHVEVALSTFAYNGKCLQNLSSHWVEYCAFYRNDSVGQGLWVGCQLFWENGDSVNNQNSSSRGDSSTFIFADPLFCDTTLAAGGKVSIYSPVLPTNSGCDFVVGSSSVGCSCGDADMSHEINVADLTFLVGYLFQGGPAPAPTEAGEMDGQAGVYITDLTYIIDFLFLGGPAPLCP
ncbi:MAG TPA: hypothetical protein VN285_04435 [Candidatus Deferrimicrobium sp.]|nr:hypothetical protein [Candidatus Deferrimicrobium sp.]